MASYKVNRKAVAHARQLIDAKRYVLDSDWGEVAPTADDENGFLKTHSWDEYAAWHLGLTDGATDETKARYAFVVGDLRARPSDGAHRVRLPRVGVAPQVDRARGPQAAPAPRQGLRLRPRSRRRPDASRR